MFGRFCRLNMFGVVLLMLIIGSPVWAQESPVSLDIPSGAKAGGDQHQQYDAKRNRSGKSLNRLPVTGKFE